jgi:hypothetical protein
MALSFSISRVSDLFMMGLCGFWLRRDSSIRQCFTKCNLGQTRWAVGVGGCRGGRGLGGSNWLSTPRVGSLGICCLNSKTQNSYTVCIYISSWGALAVATDLENCCPNDPHSKLLSDIRFSVFRPTHAPPTRMTHKPGLAHARQPERIVGLCGCYPNCPQNDM